MARAAEKRRVGALIRHRRQVLDLSQEELSLLVGVSRNAVSKWETGLSYPSKKLGKVEAVLGVSLSPDAPALDPALQRMVDGLSEDERRLLIARLRGEPDPPPAPVEGPGEGRHRRGDRAGLAG